MRRTVHIEASQFVDIDADGLWSYVEEYGNDRFWRTGLREMVPSPAGPPRVGTTVHEVVVTAGTTYVTESTVTVVGERCYRFRGHGNSGGVEGGRSVASGLDLRGWSHVERRVDCPWPWNLGA